ncbi:hypothetical protein OH77DRAFT_510161 [Trametes cingulata]|nr:hypothetical protein OH77DRAFT_510161 [Trametes cingulata]
MHGPYYGLPAYRRADAASGWTDLASKHAEMVKQKEDLEVQILSAAALLNSLLPINRLPVELLVRIFDWVQAQADEKRCNGFDPNEERRGWYGMVNVCRAWRAIIFDSPLLWRKIGVGPRQNIALFRHFLERSSPATLEVQFTGTRGLKPFLIALRPHLPRVQALHLDMLPRSQHDILLGFLRECMPSLREFSLSFGLLGWEAEYISIDGGARNGNDDGESDSDDDDSHSELNAGDVLSSFAPGKDQFPRLAELSLRNVSLEPLLALAPTLTRLHLCNCVGGRPTNLTWISRFLSFLKECKNLECLLMYKYRFRDDETRPLQRVALSPKFGMLLFKEINVHAARFLGALSIPLTASVNFTQLLIQEEDRYDPDSPFVDVEHESLPFTCLPNDRRGLPILHAVTQVQVDLQDNVPWRKERRYLGYAGTAYFAVNAPATARGASPGDITENLLDIFGGAPLVELRIAFSSEDEISADQWTRILRHFPLLQRLAVVSYAHWDDVHPVPTLLQALKATQPDRSVLCPELNALAVTVLDGDNDADVVPDIAEGLEARNAALGKRLARLRVGFLKARRCVDGQFPRTYLDREQQYVDVLSPFADKVECGCNREWGHNDHFWDDDPTP